MASKQDGVTIRISYYAHAILRELGGAQFLRAVLDDILKSHTKLIDKCAEYEKSALPDDVIKRLEQRQRPYQQLAGTVVELLDLADKVDQSQIVLPVPTERKS